MATYPRFTLRLELGPGTLLGPGKALLLAGIAETGSIAAASRRMGMSYKRAWHLIDTLNGYFGEALVVSTRGGASGGGARLTATGARVLASYRAMESAAGAAIAADLARLAGEAAGRAD